MLLGIRKVLRVEIAAPIEGARAALATPSLSLLGDHSEGQPIMLVAAAEEALGHLLAHHHLDGRATENPLSAQLAAIEVHLQEGCVVEGRAAQPCAAREERLGACDRIVRIVEGHRIAHPLSALGLLDGHQPSGLLSRQVEARVLHAQRPEKALLQEGIEGHARNHLDEIAQHIEPLAVGKLLTRMVVQRHLGQP